MAGTTLSLGAVGAPCRTPWYRRWLLAWHDAWRLQRQRRELLALDDRTLADIGVTRSEALREGGKPFWLPAEPIGHPARHDHAPFRP